MMPSHPRLVALKDVFGSYLCASYCAGVPYPQTQGLRVRIRPEALHFIFLISLHLIWVILGYHFVFRAFYMIKYRIKSSTVTFTYFCFFR